MNAKMTGRKAAWKARSPRELRAGLLQQARMPATERAATVWRGQTATNHRGPSVKPHGGDERESCVGALP